MILDSCRELALTEEKRAWLGSRVEVKINIKT